MTIFLETKRLIIKSPSINDFDKIFMLDSDPDVMRYIGNGLVRSKEESRSWYEKAVQYYAKYGYSFGLVFEKETVEFVGRAGINHNGYDDSQPDIEIGYRLFKKFWNKGYATELAIALIQWGFQSLKFEKICGFAIPDNNASRHVLEKAGMKLIGLDMYADEKVVRYEILKKDCTQYMTRMTYYALLRNATFEDINAITNVYLTSRKELVSFAPLVHTDEEIHQWIREELLPFEQVIVAEEKGTIIGMMSLTSEDGVGRIRQLYIIPAEVGHGIGSLMIKMAKSILGPPIQLYTFQENLGARRFYERHGFQAIKFNDGSENEENCPAVLYEWKK